MCLNKTECFCIFDQGVSLREEKVPRMYLDDTWTFNANDNNDDDEDGDDDG